MANWGRAGRTRIKDKLNYDGAQVSHELSPKALNEADDGKNPKNIKFIDCLFEDCSGAEIDEI